ncbi:hypothetical protein HOK68_02455 [Candidatus Woesearchaeota archaeon]|nr:hypothetical protein [Candidatus Woesearchaeota archaeon]MBT6505615.1 hypothetical protein [Candidatus Woesearchaeota archaeon]MBT7296310.1 hypothetical protein [Candidatus Woesearchaeota archaeon]
MVDVAPTAFGQVISFLYGLGFFNVVLPFLIVFAITFAILEKTSVLGEKKDNLNAIVAFCIGFFVIASASLVGILEEVLAKTILLVIAGIAFMMTAGIFSKESTWFDFELDEHGKYKDNRAKYIIWIIFFIIGLIFLGAITISTAEGQASVLSIIWNELFYQYQTGLVSGIILIVLIVASVAWMNGAWDKE